jgi:TonB family protein
VRAPPKTSRRLFIALVALSALFHLLLGWWAIPYLQGLRPTRWDMPVAVRVIDGDPLDALTPDQIERLQALEAVNADTKPEEEKEEAEEPEPKLPDGQVVETPEPDQEKIPLTSDYLAEHDNAVPEETRTEAYRVNPEVLSNMYSRESKMKFEDVIDVGAKDISTGATVGNLSDPQSNRGEGPPRSTIPSAFAVTNKEGLAAPTRASSKDQELAGAPQNDLLQEKLGAAVSLNTRAFIGAEYLNRIRRAVNFYWDQNLDNLSSSTRARLTLASYRTAVAFVLNSDGALESISVTDESGLPPLDEAVVQAFRIAGPFPNPPEQLIRKDGRIYLDMDFTVQVGRAQMQYQGIDPRAGVQFPGIMKSPR